MLNKLATLPREGRDTLFLLAVIAWVIVPQVEHLPLWCNALAASVLLWRGWLAIGAHKLPGRWWLLGLLVLTVAATLATYRTLFGQEAGVTLIVVLLALKTLELRARRDAFVVFFLGFFMMLTNFFHSQSLLTAAAMLIGLLGLLTALVNSHMPAGRPSLWQAARLAGWMALLGAPIMVILFVLFPRLAPLWGAPGDNVQGRSGLSASMKVGSIASLALDNSVAMRIRFEGPEPQQSELYFRGPVLSTFDGREWMPLQATFTRQFQAPTDLQVSGPGLRYEVTLEPHKRPWLLLLDAAPEAPALPGFTARMSSDLQWLASGPISEIVRYSAQSYPQFRHGPLQAMASLQDYVSLPPGFNPRTLQLATELRRQNPQADARALVGTVLERLRSGGYSYTLEPGVFGTHTADEFWFDRKQGFCEHIAASFVVLMRALGIPSRIVTGYQGGERNSIGNFWVVRQSDAHAWTEVWLAGQGWVRVDPTGSVAPARTGSLQRLQVEPGVIATAINTLSPGLRINLRAAWEAINNRWDQMILNYTQSKQLDLLRNIGFDSPSWEDLGLLLIGCVVLASVIGALWTLWERHRQDPWLRLLERARLRMVRARVAIPSGATPREMAQRMEQMREANDPRVGPIREWLLRLEVLRYAPPTAERKTIDLKRLRREFKRLTWPT
jgi:transglutaminase-like putative cysteine protease